MISEQVRLGGTDCLLQSGMLLANMTSFRVGGPAEWFVAPRKLEELQASVEWAKNRGLPVTLLGAGSNLLISDRGLPGLVIHTHHFQQLQFDAATGQVVAGAGKSVPRLAWQAADFGWQGLEWAVGIPGTVGGAVVMNAGAHSECTADYLVEVQTLSSEGTIEILKPQDLGYAYRTSALQGSDRLVTQATFQLKPGADPAQVRALTQDHRNHRLTTQPYHLPSCGSVFRNPLPKTAGWLIEQTGLKGYQIGGAKVAERHANFILNYSGATASDIFQLIHYIQQQVERQWSLLLKPEVKILGEFEAVD